MKTSKKDSPHVTDNYSDALIERLNKNIKDEIQYLVNIRSEINTALKGKNLVIKDGAELIEKKINSHK